MISCGNKAENAEEAVAADTTNVEATVEEGVVEQVNDSTVVEAAVAETAEVPADSVK